MEEIHAVTRCPRCGFNHTGVLFRGFTVHSKPYTHFGMCPRTQEPILMAPKKPKKRKK